MTMPGKVGCHQTRSKGGGRSKDVGNNRLMKRMARVVGGRVVDGVKSAEACAHPIPEQRREQRGPRRAARRRGPSETRPQHSITEQEADISITPPPQLAAVLTFLAANLSLAIVRYTSPPTRPVS